MTSKIGGPAFQPQQIPLPPYSKLRKLKKPDKDSMSDMLKRSKREKNAWKSIFSYFVQNNRTLRRFCMYLWRQSIKGAKISVQNMHQLKIPKYFIDEHQKACANELAEKFEAALQQEYVSSISSLSIIPFPKLHYSPDAEDRVKKALSAKIAQAGEIEKITFGWGRDFKNPHNDDPKISKLFIDACIKDEPTHYDLTLESLSEDKNDLARLVKSLKSTKTLRLSTTIESEMTKDFIYALPNLQTIVFKAPAGYPVSKLKESTWNRFDEFLKKPGLGVELDKVLKPTKERPWMEKLKKVKLKLHESNDPKVRVELKKKRGI